MSHHKLQRLPSLRMFRLQLKESERGWKSEKELVESEVAEDGMGWGLGSSTFFTRILTSE